MRTTADDDDCFCFETHAHVRTSALSLTQQKLYNHVTSEPPAGKAVRERKSPRARAHRRGVVTFRPPRDLTPTIHPGACDVQFGAHIKIEENLFRLGGFGVLWGDESNSFPRPHSQPASQPVVDDDDDDVRTSVGAYAEAPDINLK